MADENKANPKPHGRFQKWLDLVLAHATTAEKARNPGDPVDEHTEVEEEKTQ